MTISTGFALAIATCLLAAPAPRVILRKVLALGCERAGTRIQLVYTGRGIRPLYVDDRLQVTGGQGAVILQDLGQLQGRIDVRNGAMALRVVRLRTSPETWYAWAGDIKEVEIVPWEGIMSLPNYGIRSLNYLKRGPGDGYLGIVAEEKLKTAGFGQPIVTKVSGGFEVVRWLLVRQFRVDEYSVQKVKEYLGADGDYRREVLKRQQPPKIPGVRWVIPRFL